MLIDLENIPVLTAGARIVQGSRKHGFIGVLATTLQKEVVALSVSTVVADGERAQALLLDHRVPIGPAGRLAGEGEIESPISALICALPVSHELVVRSEFSCLETAGSPVDVDEGTDLYIVREGQPTAIGRLSATHATVYRRRGDQRQIYFGASEVALIDEGSVRQGDAGAAVTCAQGRLYGLLIGARDNFAIVAPLEPVFRAARLQTLSPLEASRHLEVVQTAYLKKHLASIIAAERKPQSKRLKAETIPAQRSSEELLKSSGVLDLAA